MAGKVYLIGAGPGDPGLITKKGYKYLNSADVVVYDRLVNKSLLSNLKEGAKLIYVGKTAKHHTKTQDEINEILYQEAKKDQVVARLKGGDPYVFGRGGEEGEYLYDRGIEFEEVPGITSAIGGLAYAGIPITHRGIATSFHVITGHLKDESDELNWPALANLDGTLVFLMGVSNLKKITTSLIENGKDKNTKAALVHKGTTSMQRTVTGTLETIYDIATENKITSPSLIVIGDVVSLRDKLIFHEQKPLIGKNIVITRQVSQSGSTIEKFEDLGANVITCPSIKTQAIVDNKELDKEIKNIKDYNYLVFTSVNSVKIFFDRLLELGLDARSLYNVKVAAVGPKTKEAIKEYGVVADLMPDKYIAEELIDVLKRNVTDKDNVLVPRGNLSRPILIDELEKITKVKELVVYETIRDDSNHELCIEEINELDDYYLVFTSSSTFTGFKHILGNENKHILENGKILSIGPATSKTITENGYEIYKEAESYTIDGIIDSLL